jgi:hypothetical protein
MSQPISVQDNSTSEEGNVVDKAKAKGKALLNKGKNLFKKK